MQAPITGTRSGDWVANRIGRWGSPSTIWERLSITAAGVPRSRGNYNSAQRPLWSSPPDTGSGNRTLSGGVGAGYTFARLATVRAGYHFGDQEKGDPRYTSFGCGIHFYHFHLDAAYWLSGTDSPVRNTWMLSLRIDLGRRSRP